MNAKLDLHMHISFRRNGTPWFPDRVLAAVHATRKDCRMVSLSYVWTKGFPTTSITGRLCKVKIKLEDAMIPRSHSLSLAIFKHMYIDLRYYSQPCSSVWTCCSKKWSSLVMFQFVEANWWWYIRCRLPTAQFCRERDIPTSYAYWFHF